MRNKEADSSVESWKHRKTNQQSQDHPCSFGSAARCLPSLLRLGGRWVPSVCPLSPKEIRDKKNIINCFKPSVLLRKKKWIQNSKGSKKERGEFELKDQES